MRDALNQIDFLGLMTETELMHVLRISGVSHDAKPHNVVANLKRCHHLPCTRISRQPPYPPAAAGRWVDDKLVKEAAGGYS